MKTTIKILQVFMILFIVLIAVLLSGCSSDTEDPLPADCSQSDLTITVDQVKNVSGCGASDGEIVVAGSGGSGEVSFSINATDFQSSGTFAGLAAGNYTVTVRDDNQCMDTTTAVVGLENSSLAITSVSTTDAGCNESAGQLVVNAEGTGTLVYQINSGESQTSNVFSGLVAGTYNVTVSDESGCEVIQETRVFNGTSYSQQVKNIIETNCAVSGCHNGDNGPSLNWTVFANVQSHAARIKSFTQSGQMPPPGSGQSLTEQEKDLIACWVDDGARNN